MPRNTGRKCPKCGELECECRPEDIEVTRRCLMKCGRKVKSQLTNAALGHGPEGVRPFETTLFCSKACENAYLKRAIAPLGAKEFKQLALSFRFKRAKAAGHETVQP